MIVLVDSRETYNFISNISSKVRVDIVDHCIVLKNRAIVSGGGIFGQVVLVI